MCFNSSNLVTKNDSLYASLRCEQDYAQKGFLTKVDICIKSYDIHKYDFLQNTKEAPPSVHENLWEEAKLNMNIGLHRVNRITENEQPRKNNRYEVQFGDIFQIRGYDLANMTLVFDGNGWVVMDVLTTTETSDFVWQEIVQKYLLPAPINMVIYSHSHIDHYGGIGGLKLFFSESIRIISPKGFMEHAISENIYAGTAMSRRAIYQYGSTLAASIKGQVDCGLGKAVSHGENSIIAPTLEIGSDDYDNEKNYRTETSGLLKMQIQYTPGTEAPAEMNVYLPDQRVLFIAENCAGTLHNALTPRGAQVRDLLVWADFLDQTLIIFPDMEIICAAHNWPRFSNEECVRFIEIQRDMYRFINNATLHLANRGFTIDEAGRMIESSIPSEFIDEWCCHGFYGTYSHNAKAVYQRYIGWYDGNPSHLNRHALSERADRYLDAFGAEAVFNEAVRAVYAKDYTWAVELFDYILNADSDKTACVIDKARPVYAEALRKLGFQSEASTWRNMYLTGAQEVMMGGKINDYADDFLQFTDDTVNAMSLEMILQYLGIMLDYKKASESRLLLKLCVEVITGGISEYADVNAGRGVLNYRILSEPDLSIICPDIVVKGSKLDFFRAFVDHDESMIYDIIEDARQQGKAVRFIQEYITRFHIGFPIMTPRKPY